MVSRVVLMKARADLSIAWKRIEQVLGDLDAVTRIMLSALGLIIVGIILETGE